MKNSLTISSAVLTALAIAATVAPIAASADSTSSTSWSSTGTVAFTSPSTGTTPPNITDPSNPGTTPNPGLPSQPGNFAIDYASNLDFGSHTISATAKTYYANLDAKATAAGYSGANFVSIHDLRGVATGWTLSVTQAAQFTSGTSNLTNAAITFNYGKGINSGGGTEQPTATSTFTLTPGTAQAVMSDSTGIVGNYAAQYGSASYYKGTETGGPISLYIPSGAVQATSYTSTLNWNLAAVPS